MRSWVSRGDAARELGVSPQRVSALVRERRLVADHDDEGRVMIDGSSLARFVAARRRDDDDPRAAADAEAAAEDARKLRRERSAARKERIAETRAWRRELVAALQSIAARLPRLLQP